MAGNTTTRFSDRVRDYSSYRPGYPAAAIDCIVETCDLQAASVVADIGSGTGIFTRQLLQEDLQVIAVEPNRKMREASDLALGDYQNYHSLDATAEATTLETGSVDLITAAQAFHWFDLRAAKAEFMRILRPQGNTCLIWNRRNAAGSAFLADYEAMLQSMLPEYARVSHARASDDVVRQFLGAETEIHQFDNVQKFDLQGLKGRLMSSSYCPAPDTDGHQPVMQALSRLFDRYNENGSVAFSYITQVYVGPPVSAAGC